MIWTLRKKRFIGYSIVLVLLVVVFIWAFIYLLMLGQASNAILKNNYNSILAADNMVGAIERQDSAILLVILGYEKDGVKQYVTEVVGEELGFADTKKGDSGNSQPTTPGFFPVDSGEDELPF